jgi:anthranilate phosphoribosyltransferase
MMLWLNWNSFLCFTYYLFARFVHRKLQAFWAIRAFLYLKNIFLVTDKLSVGLQSDAQFLVQARFKLLLIIVARIVSVDTALI